MAVNLLGMLPKNTDSKTSKTNCDRNVLDNFETLKVEDAKKIQLPNYKVLQTYIRTKSCSKKLCDHLRFLTIKKARLLNLIKVSVFGYARILKNNKPFTEDDAFSANDDDDTNKINKTI